MGLNFLFDTLKQLPYNEIKEELGSRRVFTIFPFKILLNYLMSFS